MFQFTLNAVRIILLYKGVLPPIKCHQQQVGTVNCGHNSALKMFYYLLKETWSFKKGLVKCDQTQYMDKNWGIKIVSSFINNIVFPAYPKHCLSQTDCWLLCCGIFFLISPETNMQAQLWNVGCNVVISCLISIYEIYEVLFISLFSNFTFLPIQFVQHYSNILSIIVTMVCQ